MNKRTSRLALLVGCILLVRYCMASAGDEQISFKDCVHACSQVECPTRLPLMLRLLRWSCQENCGYRCMQDLTKQAIQNNRIVLQYQGKWPFHRLWGLQEPASILFSIGNGFVHYKYCRRLRLQLPSVYFFKPFIVAYALIGMNAWLWSSVFHARDTPTTEKLDYFSASLLILYSLYFAILRIFHLHHATVIQALGTIFLSLFALHVTYLTLFRFDYSYNIAASVTVGVLQFTLWIGWCALQYIQPANASRRPYAYLVVLSVVGGAAAMSFELYDFPPVWGIFDAHSLWHLATIPITIVWYRFVIHDARHELSLRTTPVLLS